MLYHESLLSASVERHTSSSCVSDSSSNVVESDIIITASLL